MSEQIVVLSNKDKVRSMINLYHGSAENHINMIKELIGNSLDIFKKNFPNRENNKIHVIIHNSNKIEFIDNASGIPIEGIATDNSPNYEAIFEKDCAGSNYGKHTDTIGQHGVFLYTLTMTSEDIEYFIARPNNNVYNIKYHKGNRTSDLKIIDNCQDTYTKMIFSLDKEVWNNPIFSFEEICNIAQGQSALMNVEISVTDKENGLNKVFFYKNGIEDFFKESTLDKKVTTENIRMIKEITDVFKKKGTNIDLTDNIKIDMIFNYSNDDKECFQKEFLNTADLIQHGTIQEGIIYGLKSSIDKWLEKNNKYNKNEKHISNEDILTGLNYICNFRSLYIEYENQTKQKTSVKRCKNIMKDIIEEYMEIFFIENHLQSEIICSQVLINARARVKADNVRQDEKKKAKSGLTRPTVTKLTDCTSKDPKECEIFLCEGDSAGGNAKQCRNKKTQAILPQRGKSKNIEKGNSSKKNKKEAQDLKNIELALQCGTGKNYDESKLRYNSVILMADGDSDGSGHIVPLWLTYFHREMKELILNGHVYIAMPPLYKNVVGKGKDISIHYTYTEDEQIKFLSENRVEEVQRYKGLGEMNADQLWDTTMNPETRQLIQVKINDLQETEDTFELLMGEKVEPRYNFIMENAKFAKNIDI